MSVKIVSLSNTRKDVKAFVRFAEEVYRNDTHWTPPLLGDQIRYIQAGPFMRMGEKQLLFAYRGNRPVARLSVHRNFSHDACYGAGQGFFGFFEALHDPEAVQSLFEAGATWLRSRGCREILGPMSFSIYDEIGLLVHGFDEVPTVLCPYNLPYYGELLENVGYRKEVDWYGYRFNRQIRFSPAVDQIHRRVLSHPGLVIRPLNLKDRLGEGAVVQRIFNGAWAENWGHVPIGDEQWQFIIHKLLMAIVKEMSWIIMVDGEPVGFLITVLDMNQALKKANGRLLPLGIFKLLWHTRNIRRIRIIVMGVLKSYQYRGYELALAAEALKRGIELGYDVCDCSQIVETNHRMAQGLDALGGERYKTFRIYRKTLSERSG